MPQDQDPYPQTEPSRRNVRSPLNEALTEEIDARFLRSMLYEPLPGSAAVILVQLGIIEEGQIEALGARTYDAESARLSLALDDGRTVELERAMHLHTENGYAVRIRSRAGQTISRSFIHIDRDLGVRNLYNDRMVYIDDTDQTANAQESEPSEAEIEAVADAAHEAELHARTSDKDELPAEIAAAANSHHPPTPETLREAEVSAVSVPEAVNVIGEFAFPAEPMTPTQSAADGAAAAPESALETQSALASESTSAESTSAESNSEMLEIPDRDLANILYFHETTIPDQGEPQDTGTDQIESLIHAAPEAPQAVASDPDQAATEAASPEPTAPEPTAEPATPPAVAEPYELHPDYIPLHAALAPAEAADFLFIARTGTIYTYEHCQTFRYIHIDAPSGLFYDQTRTPISHTAALKRALTPQPGQPPVISATPEQDLSAQTRAGEQSQNQFHIDPPHEAKTEAKTEAHPELRPATSSPAHPEPELRVRTTYAARAAVIKPEPAQDSQLTPSDHAPSFDAFTRKHGSPLDRDSWRDRVAGLRRALRPGRNPDGSNSNSDS